MTTALRLPLRGSPRYLFLEVTSECHLRCKMCHLWRTREPVDALTTDEKLDLVREYGAWAGPGSVVVLTGGEPFRKTDEVMTLCRAARAHGLTTAANTTGTTFEESVYDELLDVGPHYLVISLDAPDPAVHDWMRGTPGTFERTTRVIRDLVRHRARRSARSDVQILVNAVLCRRTLPLALAHVDFVRDLGADGIMFQALARTFMNTAPGDPFFESQRPTDMAEVDRVVDALVRSRATDAFVRSEQRDLEWMKLYFRDPDFISEPVCGSGDRNLMVNQFGEVTLCFAMKEISGGAALGHVRWSSLRSLWDAEEAGRLRSIMSGCRKSCGMLHCHRREGT